MTRSSSTGEALVAATIDQRTLTATTLQRQMLLERHSLTPVDAVERLGGLNAQDALPPYLSLWSRVAGFSPDALTAALVSRAVVRGSLLRNTQHLVTARQYLAWRRALQPVIDRSRQGFHGSGTRGVDLAALAEVAQQLLRSGVRTRQELAAELAPHWPEADPQALAWSVSAVLAVVHPPTSATWDKRAGATSFTLAEDWLGEGPREAASGVPDLIAGYLAAFGPATTMDIQAWSGLTHLREVLPDLAGLRTYDGPAGLLWDLEDAELADPQVDLPTRLLPAVDNLLTAFAERSRVLPPAVQPQVCQGAVVHPTVLVDGQVVAIWRAPTPRRVRDPATLEVLPLSRIGVRRRRAIEQEAAALLTFLHPQRAIQVSFA